MIRLAFWLLVLFLALSYFNISLEAIINSPAGQHNLHYLSQVFSDAVAWVATYVQNIGRGVTGH